MANGLVVAGNEGRGRDDVVVQETDDGRVASAHAEVSGATGAAVFLEAHYREIEPALELEGNIGLGGRGARIVDDGDGEVSEGLRSQGLEAALQAAGALERGNDNVDGGHAGLPRIVLQEE